MPIQCTYWQAASQSTEAAATQSIFEVSLPIALSGLTTALGFIAISLIRIEAIRNIGTFGALGVLLVCGATLTAGPAALVLWPLPMRPLLSIADSLRQLHGGFVGDPTYPLPTDGPQIAQYLVLLESKPYIQDLITPDRSSANLLMRVDDNSSGALMHVADMANEWWRQNGPDGFEARTTGIMYEFGKAEDAIAYGQLRGLAFAFLTVSAVLLAIFRWVRLALVALLPNMIPVAMVFGAMGLLGVPLDAGTVVIENLAFGIAVDDSIHAVTAYFSRRSSEPDAAVALRGAYERVLPPLVFTTVAVTLGFAVLGMSGFTLIRNLGMLTAGLMVLCLLADVLLLPALMSGLGSPPAYALASGESD